ncbi:TPA: hypothetical protein ACGPBC_000704 [Streptococcus suis]
MFKITVFTDIIKAESEVDSYEEAMKIRQKVISQMNNGHAIVVGKHVINPAHVRIIDFRHQEENHD